MIKKFFLDERGANDLLGYVLVFSLILAVVAVVSAVGFTDLNNTRDTEERRNIERAFEILQDNIEEVVRGEAPARGTEVKVGDNDLYLDEEVNVTLLVSNSTYTNRLVAITQPITVETTSGMKVMYVNGALARSNVGGSSFISEPMLIVEDNKMMMPLIEVSALGNKATAVSGRTFVVRTYDGGRGARVFDGNEFTGSTDTYTVDLIVTSPRVSMWTRWCESHPNLAVTGVSGNEVRCSVSPDSGTEFSSVHISFSRLNVQFS